MNAGDRAIRATTTAVVVGLALVAGYVSYRHASDVVRAHGEHGSTAALVPLTIDGMVYVASMTLLDAARRRRPSPVLAKITLALGITATIAVNVLDGIAHGPVGAVIAAWPAVCLVLAYELLMELIKGAPDRDEAHPLQEARGSDEDGGAHLVDAVEQVYANADAPAAPDDEVRVLELFADELRDGCVPSQREIKRRLRCGWPRARQVQEHLQAALAG